MFLTLIEVALHFLYIKNYTLNCFTYIAAKQYIIYIVNIEVMSLRRIEDVSYYLYIKKYTMNCFI